MRNIIGTRVYRSFAQLLVTVLLLAGTASVAHADFSRKVTATFKNQIVLSTAELPSGKTDKETIDGIKKSRLAQVPGHDAGEGKAWSFHYTAFLGKGAAPTLMVKFYTADKAASYVADLTLSGVDPKSTVLSGDLTISEDEGLTRGKPYIMKIVLANDTVLAQTAVTMQ